MTTALEWTAARGETDVSAATEDAAAARDAIRLIDGDPEDESRAQAGV